MLALEVEVGGTVDAAAEKGLPDCLAAPRAGTVSPGSKDQLT